MTDVNPFTSALSGTVGSTGASGAAKDKTAMGKDDFLKLLVGQLQHQDPLDPSSDTEFIGQMAQFSQLEQESNTAQSTADMAEQLGRTGALGLIGRSVTYADADGNPHSGTVTQVDVGKDGKATLTIGSSGGIDAGSVTQVK